MSRDLACLAFLSVIGFSGSLGAVVTAGIQVPPDVVAIEALELSKPVAASAGMFLKPANGERLLRRSDEALLTEI